MYDDLIIGKTLGKTCKPRVFTGRNNCIRERMDVERNDPSWKLNSDGGYGIPEPELAGPVVLMSLPVSPNTRASRLVAISPHN